MYIMYPMIKIQSMVERLVTRYHDDLGKITSVVRGDETNSGGTVSYGYNWLTLAEYGEGDNLTDHKNRYTENSPEFMRNGGIRRLQKETCYSRMDIMLKSRKERRKSGRLPK